MEVQTLCADAVERTERHLRMAAELAELAMQLARAAAAEALARAARDAEAEAEADAISPPPASRRTGPDPVREFAMLSREVGRLITLEARLAAGSRSPGRERPRSSAAELRTAPSQKITAEMIPEEPPGPAPEAPSPSLAAEAPPPTIDATPDAEPVGHPTPEAAALDPVALAACCGFQLRADRPLQGIWFGSVWRPLAPCRGPILADAAGGSDPPG